MASAAEPIAGAAAESSAGSYFTRGLRLLLRFARPARGRLALAAALAVVATAFEFWPFVLVYQAVSALALGQADEPSLLRIAALLALAVVARFLFMGLSLWVSHVAAFDILYRLRLAAAERLARVPLGWLGYTRSGGVKKVLLDDVERLETFLAHGVPDMVSALAIWLLASIWLFALDWRMALAALAVIPVSFGAMFAAMAAEQPRIAVWQRAMARMNGAVVEYLAGIRVVKVFNRTGEAFAETKNAVLDCAAYETDWARQFLPVGSLFYSLVIANVVVILPVGLWLHQAGSISTPTLLFFFIVGLGYSQPLLRFFGQFMNFNHMVSGGSEIEALLLAPELLDTGRRVTLGALDVEFRGVSFAYDGRRVLDDVSFVARQGCVTALVGPSGAGKTTIARLAARFFDPDAGEVRIGGVAAREMALDQLMDQVSFVFQETFLFHDTIAANLRVGRADASDAELAAAAEAARALDFVTALPDGFETQVGERGATLSGGERQRLAIARALLKGAPIVVLDEATAFADPENEAAIQDGLSRLARGRTVLVVAHRLSTVAGADQILVVDAGRIVERGRHADLLAAGGLYARLWQDFVAAEGIRLHASEGSA